MPKNQERDMGITREFLERQKNQCWKKDQLYSKFYKHSMNEESVEDFELMMEEAEEFLEDMRTLDRLRKI